MVLYVLESSHSNLRSVLHLVLPSTPLPLGFRPCAAALCVRLDQTFPVANTQRYLLLRPIVARYHSPPSCTTLRLHQLSHEVLRGSFGSFHASFAPLVLPNPTRSILTLQARRCAHRHNFGLQLGILRFEPVSRQLSLSMLIRRSKSRRRV